MDDDDWSSSNPEHRALAAMLCGVARVYAVPPALVASVLGITTRHLQRLVAEGVLPGPTQRGRYDLPSCLRAFRLYRREISVPQTFVAALHRFIDARNVLDECVRRHPEQRPEHYTRAEDCLWPLPPMRAKDGASLPDLPPLDPDKVSEAELCAILGLSSFALLALVRAGVIRAPMTPVRVATPSADIIDE